MVTTCPKCRAYRLCLNVYAGLAMLVMYAVSQMATCMSSEQFTDVDIFGVDISELQRRADQWNTHRRV